MSIFQGRLIRKRSKTGVPSAPLPALRVSVRDITTYEGIRGFIGPENKESKVKG